MEKEINKVQLKLDEVDVVKNKIDVSVLKF